MSASVTVEAPSPGSSWPWARAESGAEHFLEPGRGDGPAGPDVELDDISARQNPFADIGCGTSDEHSVGRQSAFIEETMAGSSICGRG